jgi:hypothetical protein
MYLGEVFFLRSVNRTGTHAFNVLHIFRYLRLGCLKAPVVGILDTATTLVITQFF